MGASHPYVTRNIQHTFSVRLSLKPLESRSCLKITLYFEVFYCPTFTLFKYWDPPASRNINNTAFLSFIFCLYLPLFLHGFFNFFSPITNLRRLHRSKNNHQKFIVTSQIIGSGQIDSFMFIESVIASISIFNYQKLIAHQLNF